jgi:peptidoglycan/LPS O-acetylase OafA/YrhL
MSIITQSQNQPAQSSRQRLVFLDFLRGIAVLAVFIEHVGETISPQGFGSFATGVFDFGKFGLSLFFIISGFIIPYSLEKKNSIRLFWLNRFFRLYPIYWTNIAIMLVFYLCGAVTIFSEAYRSNITLHSLVNLTMLQDFLRVPQANAICYTLTLEFVFYICCSALFAFRIHKHSYQLAAIGLAMVGFSGIFVPLILERKVPLSGMFYILTMFIGTTIYRYYAGTVTKKQLSLLLSAIVLFISAAVYFNYGFHRADLPRYHFAYPAIVSAWFSGYLLFLVCLKFREKSFPNVFLWLGKISYSIYLMHSLIIYTFMHFTRFSALPGIVQFSVTLAATLLLSSLTYYIIEAPSIKLGSASQRWVMLKRAQV